MAGGITSKSYVVTGLTTGSTYQFRVQSRNAIGLSTFSNIVTATAAIVPAPPNARLAVPKFPPAVQAEPSYSSVAAV